MVVTLRELFPKDAEELLRLQHQLDQETSFMLLEPDERQTGLQQTKVMLESFTNADRSIFIGAEADGQLVGFLSVRGGSVKRNQHCGYIVIGILKQYQGMGIGTSLFQKLDTWAVDRGIVRLELTVMTHNQRALALYTKSGFELEGTKRKSLYIDEEWVDEYCMGKIVPSLTKGVSP